jgi:hypothetical protein
MKGKKEVTAPINAIIDRINAFDNVIKDDVMANKDVFKRVLEVRLHFIESLEELTLELRKIYK